MRNKQKGLNFFLIFIFTFFLLINITLPSVVTPSSFNTKTVYALTQVSASVNNKTPLQNTTVNVTVNGPAKSSVVIVCHYKSTNTTYKSTIGSNGKAIIPVKISRATKGFAVVINVSVTYKGKVYTTKTSFKPR